MNNTNTSSIRFHGIKDGDTFKIGNMDFIKFPDVNGVTPVVMRDIAFTSRFGNNNLAESVALKKMKEEILPEIIAAVGEENLCVIETDLRTLDGLNPYGKTMSLISLPTLDFYRANVDIFDKHKVDEWWWLATPESAQPHDAPYWILCVSPSGLIDSLRYGSVSGVRPFCILKSSIFESSEA